MPRPRSHSARTTQQGLTLLEVMVTLAVIGGLMFIVRSGFRRVTKADLVEDTTALAQLVQRTSQLAIERGEMHRLVIDMDKQVYAVEVCQGSQTLVRNEAPTSDPVKTKEAIEHAKQRMGQMPADAFSSGEPGDAARRVAALAGQHVDDRTCTLAQGGLTGDTSGKKWARALQAGRGVKFKEIWVAHQEESATKGQVMIYFFPTGAAEKAIIEVADGSDVLSVLVYGLTGRIELRDGEVKNVDDHMLRNAMGTKDKARDAEELDK